eukprot:g18681.t1
MLLHARTRLRDFSYEPPRSRAPLTYYYPVRSRSSTPRRRDSPTPRYLNSVKNSYGHLGPAGTGAGGAQSTVPVPTTGTLAPGSGPVPTPTGPVFQTSMAPVYSKTSLAPGAPHSQTLLHIKQVPTPCKLRTEVISSALPTTLAPSGSSYITSKEPGSTDSGGNSLCSTMNRNQVSKSAAAPVPGQSAHSLLGPARQTSMDLVQTIQMTSAELQDCMTKQQQQQMQDKEQELQLTKVSLEEKDKAVAKLERELLEKEDELNEIRHDRDEQAGRKEEEVAEREKTILHLQARVECLEQEHTQKDEWCRKRDEAARKLEGTLRSKESSFEAQLAKKDQEPKLRDELSQLSISDVCCLLGTLFSDSFGSDRRNLIHVCYKWTLRNHVLHLMCLRCHEFQEIDMKNHELRERENELRKKDHEIETLKKQVRSLQDQVIIDRQHVEDCNGLQTEMRNTNCALLQERQVRERELQEKSEELTKFLLDLDARSQGDIPSAIKSREASCSSFRLEQLAKSEADLLMLQQWQHAQMAQMA